MSIVLNEKTSGKAAFAYVKKAIKDYSQKTGLNVTLQDFCKVAKLSRQQLYLYNKGHKPAEEGLAKIATGLKAWGNEVTINF